MDKRAGEFIGKTVISLSGERLGEINNLTFDKYFKKLKNLVVFNDEQEEFYIREKNIFCHGENAVFLKTNLKPPAENTYVSPLNVRAYDISGKLIGTIVDVLFEEDYKTVKCLLSDDKKQYLSQNIVAHGKDAVIFDFSEKPKKISVKKPEEDIEDLSAVHFTESPPEKEGQQAVSEANEPNAKESTAAADGEKPKEPIEPQKPSNIVVGAKMLIGRKVKKDIFLRTGKLLIKEGTFITIDVINLALKYGKLFELTVNSIGNLP